MHEDRRFPFEKMAKLDSPDRLARQPPAALVELVVRHQPRRILDLGAGTGYLALPLAAALPEAQVFALDVEPRMLEVIRERAGTLGLSQHVTPVLTPPDALPFASGEVDIAVMVNIYHELSNRSAYLVETRRVLGRRGLLLICDWDPNGTDAAGPPLDHRVRREDAAAELHTAGFVEVESHPLFVGFWTVTARRSTAGDE